MDLDEGLTKYRDREPDALSLFEASLRARLADLVTPELLDEHRRNPVGHHSPALGVVLTALRQAPTQKKLALLAIEPGPQWMIIRLSGRPGVAHDMSDPARFLDENAALHEVFVRRLDELGVHTSGRAAT